jgi:hypothetical protein
MRRRCAHAAQALVLIAIILGGAGVASGVAAPAHHPQHERARITRTLSGADVAHLQFVHEALRGNREVIYEKGKAQGALPGDMRAEIEVTPSLLIGTCTIKTADGSVITGEGRATANGSGRYESFRGTLTITKGTGRYRHIHGHAGLYGTFDHRSFALVVQTTGTLSY